MKFYEECWSEDESSFYLWKIYIWNVARWGDLEGKPEYNESGYPSDWPSEETEPLVRLMRVSLGKRQRNSQFQGKLTSEQCVTIKISLEQLLDAVNESRITQTKQVINGLQTAIDKNEDLIFYSE